MKKYLGNICVFGLGFAFASILANSQPVSENTLLLEGLLSFAHDLEAYGIASEFDPRSCEIVAAPKAEQQDLGSYMVFICRRNTEKGEFLMYRGYDRSGRTVDGGQGFEDVK